MKKEKQKIEIKWKIKRKNEKLNYMKKQNIRNEIKLENKKN